MSGVSLKQQTARSVKWNAIDRLSTQALYGVTGLVLAWLLTDVDFGLVGTLLIFQAFASLLIDSGLSYALLQRKSPTRLDYSSVLWFNVLVAVVIYIILYMCAPLIARFFSGDTRLIPLSRVMFVTFILNASSIVQVNMLTKQMNVRPVAVANVVSLTLGGVIAIVVALRGHGAWALVWQSIVNTGTKSVILWVWTRWRPLWRLSWRSLRGFAGVGGSMMATSALNTLFTYINSILIGNRLGMAQLGYYTQSDKWSKMGTMSILQTLTSSFLPPLSATQDDPERYRRLCSKMNRMTAYVLFPVMVGLIVAAPQIFHTLFGAKWDLSIGMFRLLLVRGMFTIVNGVYNDYILSLGRSRLIVWMEVVRDGTAIVMLVATLPFLAMQTPDNPVYGIYILLYGQIAASAMAWAVTIVATCRVTGARVTDYLMDMAPYAAITAAITPLLLWMGGWQTWPALALVCQAAAGTGLYVAANHVLGSRIQADALDYLLRRKG